MLTLTWFGFLPGRASRNIYENQDAGAGEREVFCRPDLEMVQRSSRLEGVSFKDLYFVRRVGYQGLEQDFTWIAKCESIRDSMQDRVGAYRGAGVMLSGTTISGKVAYRTLTGVFDWMTRYVPSVLPRGFSLPDVVRQALAQRDVQKVIDTVRATVSENERHHQEGAGLSLATGNFAVGIVDISSLQPDRRPEIIARFLENAQTNPQYHQFGELYISAEPHVVAAAKRIPNAQIIPLDWDPKPKKVAAFSHPQEAPAYEVEGEEEMSDQKLLQIRDSLIEQMRNEAAKQALIQVNALERRLAHNDENSSVQPPGAGQGLHWSRVLGWLAAFAAMIAISVSASVYLAPRNVGGAPADVGPAIETALKPINEAVGNADEQIKGLVKRLEALEQPSRVSSGAPVLPSPTMPPGGISKESTGYVLESVVTIKNTISTLEEKARNAQPHVKTELRRVADILRQYIPVICERTGVVPVPDECKAPPAR